MIIRALCAAKLGGEEAAGSTSVPGEAGGPGGGLLLLYFVLTGGEGGTFNPHSFVNTYCSGCGRGFLALRGSWKCRLRNRMMRARGWVSKIIWMAVGVYTAFER